jgi:CheY-like chemotaxis protein
MATGQTSAVKMELVNTVVNWQADAAPSLHESHILIVDDDPGVRETVTLLLAAAGYRTSTAENGFEALQKLKAMTPSMIMCDLDMPNMSGFELLSIVRRRFPAVPVIAMSGLYSGDSVPEGVIADAFYGKGQQTPPELFRKIADVLHRAAVHSQSREAAPAPAWGRWLGTDACNTSYVLVPCDECLRSFPVALRDNSSTGIQSAHCIFCGAGIQYIYEREISNHDYMSMVFKFFTQEQVHA